MKKDKKKVSYYVIISLVIVSMVLFLSESIKAQYIMPGGLIYNDHMPIGYSMTATDPFLSTESFVCSYTKIDPFKPLPPPSPGSGYTSSPSYNVNLNYPSGLESVQWWYNQAMERYNEIFMSMNNYLIPSMNNIWFPLGASGFQYSYSN